MYNTPLSQTDGLEPRDCRLPACAGFSKLVCRAWEKGIQGRRGADDRLTLRQADTRLGVSASAIRKRVECGTLRSDKGPDGRRYVYLETAELGADTRADTPATLERDMPKEMLRVAWPLGILMVAGGIVLLVMSVWGGMAPGMKPM